MTTTQTSSKHGIAMLHAASIALDAHVKPQPIPKSSSIVRPISIHSSQYNSSVSTSSNAVSLSALLNPIPSSSSKPTNIPPGYILAKDGKIKKKRGRKPTPGLSEEDRRQARLLKNRRTAETSRRRKLALLNRLTIERDQAIKNNQQLIQLNQTLLSRLAKSLGKSIQQLIKDEPQLEYKQIQQQQPNDTTNTSLPISLAENSDLAPSSTPTSVAGSDSENGTKK